MTRESLEYPDILCEWDEDGLEIQTEYGQGCKGESGDTERDVGVSNGVCYWFCDRHGFNTQRGKRTRGDLAGGQNPTDLPSDFLLLL